MKSFIKEYPDTLFHEISGIGISAPQRAVRSMAPHSHNTFEISYIDKGMQIAKSEEKYYTFYGGDVYIYKPLELHGTGIYPLEKAVICWLRIDIPRCSESFLGVSSDITGLLQNNFLDLDNMKNIVADDELKTVIRKLFNEYKKISPNKVLIISYVLEMLYRVVECARNNNKITYPDIEKAIAYIEENIYKIISIPELAQISGLSESGLLAKFHKTVGITPSEFIARKKIEAATNYLLQGMTVSRVSEMFDFSSPQYFSTVYKKFTGITPSEVMQFKK